jgi:hypothetical protein
LLLLIAWVAVKRYPMVVTVGIFLTAFHLCLMLALTCWTANFNARNPPEPMMNFHAGFLSFVVLGRNFQREFGEHRHTHWFLVYAVYWFGLVVNFFWIRWWLLRNFDRLVGRTRPRERLQASAAPDVHTSPPARAEQAPASVAGT